MNKLILILASGSALAAVPAMAQDTTEPGSTFTGPRVEAILGYDVTKAGSSVDDDVSINNDQSTEGLLYGVGVGYDFDAGPVVIGAEAEYTDSTAKTKYEEGDFEGFGFGNVKAGRDLYVGARIGAKVSPKALVYVKGGYTNAKYDIRTSDGTTELNEDIDTDGYRIGVGAEYALRENTFAKLEYRYSKYSKAEIDMEGTLPDSDRFDVDTDRHQVVAAVGWRF